MSKLLFTHSYFYQYDSKQWRFKQPYPPYGTIYAAAMMREKGHEVSMFDTNLVANHEAIERSLKKENPNYLVIYDDGFNYLTKMCLTNMREAAFAMSKLGKEYGCTVIVNSSDSTDHYEKYLNEGADFVMHGEGELTLDELINSLDNGQDFKDIKGISYKINDEIIKNPRRPVLVELDTLPRPAWDLVDIEAYRNIWINGHGYFSLNIATTRGCPYKCNWCAKPIYGNRYNSRSPKAVVDEIEFLINAYKVNYFWMCDDIFGLKPNWVQEFNDIIQERKLDFKYKIQSRADLLLKEDNIQVLADSGLDTVWIGAESGSQKILDAMDKGTTTDQIYEATRILKSKGIRIAFFLQFGYLGETQEDIDKTLDMVLDLMPDEIGISVSYPLPGTGFYEKVQEELKQKANWTDSDDLDLMFKNTYNPGYYRKLHRYVHNRYKLKRGLLNLKSAITDPLSIEKGRIRSIGSMAYHLPMTLVNGYKLKKLALEKS